MVTRSTDLARHPQATDAVGPSAQLLIDELTASVYTIPTDSPESDGTLEWNATTMVLVDVAAAGCHGLGYTYAAASAGPLIAEALAPTVVGTPAWRTTSALRSMVAAVRNLGRPGIAATAISAIDIAMWDLKARLAGVPLADFLGRCHDSVAAYGSGGFTSYSDNRLADQLGHWAEDGFGAVKMKVGREPAADPRRVALARSAIGPDVGLFVDANGAHDRRSAAAAAASFEASGVTWFEEPVSSDDRAGLRWLRSRVPSGMAVAAGEYAWGPDAARELLHDDAVDVLQLDATRCLGISGFLQASSLAAAFHVPISAHCAPALHSHLVSAVPGSVNLEWFHDHVRVERLLFDGVPTPVDGRVSPDERRPGLGLELRARDAQPYLRWRS